MRTARRARGFHGGGRRGRYGRVRPRHVHGDARPPTFARRTMAERRRSLIVADLVVAHLYPDLMRTYGDRGNIIALTRRAEWRGIEVDVVSVSRGEPLPAQCGLVFIGGGSDRVQQAVASDFLGRQRQLADLADSGRVVV